MNKNHTISIFLLSVFTALLSIGLFIFLFKVIENKNKHTSAVLTTLEEKMTEREKAKTLEEEFSKIEITRQELEDYFVKISKIDTFVSYLENLGSSIGVELLVKNFEISKTNPNIIMVKIFINGSFSRVMQTIAILENAPYQIDITQVYLNKETKEITTGLEEKNTTQVLSWQADITFNILSSS